ncbi:MAG: 16S rRNA (cytosine(967)-C(5))-methyltransferase RsmB [Clostridia bacterium]|nr:16S rRNA (cytosine(967)-C(5))-methyltransferase RsmB [Clostridia bacterium]
MKSNYRAPANDDARKLALYALSDVVRSKAYSTLTLDDHLRKSRLSLEDKRLATMIFYTALENRIRIEWVLAQFVDTMPKVAIEDILHVAAAQILFMDRIPDYAAVDMAVRQAKDLGLEVYAPFVNGTLRTLIRARDAGEIKYPDENEDIVKYLCVMHSLPEALTLRLIDDYGVDEARELIRYVPDERTQTVRPNLIKMNDAEFEKYLDTRRFEHTRGVAPHSWKIRGGGDLASDPGYKAGLFSIQGEGAMLAAYAVDPKYGWNVIDACAAPGGKSCLICELMGGNTGRVLAWDVNEKRTQLIRAAKDRLRLDNLRVAALDARKPRPDYEGQYDAVLIDAPCTGLGVMVNKPEIKYKVTNEGIESLKQIQSDILDACSDYVKPGGRLVYSTCTIIREENEKQIERFLSRNERYAPDLDDNWLPEELKPRFKNGMIQLMPHRDGMEGFFIARLKRI